MNETIKTGVPTNPPIWWVAHEDEKALVCDDGKHKCESALIV